MIETSVDISVIIVSYNSRNLLALTLGSVERAIEGLTAEVFVVDNDSTDGTPEWLRQNAPWVKLIDLGENIGFSRANNVALEQCSGDVVLLLNPDTIIAHDTLTQLVSHFRATPGSGAVGVHMTNGLGLFLKESKRGYPGLATSFFKLSRLWRLSPHSATLNAYYIGDKGEFDVCHAPNLSGACMAFSHELLDKVGGFDPEFFMYCEDTDLSWRMEKASEKGDFYRGDISILHFKGQSTLRGKKYIWYFYQSMLRFARKHEYPNHNALVNWITKIGIGVAYTFSMARCIIMRHIEKSISFSVPQRIAVVTDNDGSLPFLRANALPEISEVTAVRYSELETMSARQYEAVVFDTDTPYFVNALRFMERNAEKTKYGFLDAKWKACLVFFNNVCHSLLG